VRSSSIDPWYHIQIFGTAFRSWADDLVVLPFPIPWTRNVAQDFEHPTCFLARKLSTLASPAAHHHDTGSSI